MNTLADLIVSHIHLIPKGVIGEFDKLRLVLAGNGVIDVGVEFLDEAYLVAVSGTPSPAMEHFVRQMRQACGDVLCTRSYWRAGVNRESILVREYFVTLQS